MITVDREKAKEFLDGITLECDPPYNAPITESELNVFIEMIEDGPGEQECSSYFEWLDQTRGGLS